MEGYQSGMENLEEYAALVRELEADRTAAKGAPTEERRQALSERLQRIFQREEATPPAVFLPMPFLRERFGLDLKGLFLVAVAAAFELDGALRMGYAAQWGREAPDLHFGFLLLELLLPLDSGIFSIALEESALTLCLLREEREEGFLLERPLRLIRGAVGLLTCGSVMERPCFQLYQAGREPLLPLHGEAVRRLAALLSMKEPKLIFLLGRAGTGRRSLVKLAATQAGGPDAVVFLSAKRLGTPGTPAFDDAAREAVFAAVCYGAPVCVTDAQEAREAVERLLERLEQFALTAIVCLSAPPEREWRAEGYLRAELRLPDFLEPVDNRTAWWGFSAGASPAAYSPGEMAARYRFSAGDVRRVAEGAALRARMEGRSAREDDVAEAVRERNRLPDSGVLLPEGASMEELVVPDAVRRQLLRICGLVRHRGELAEDWGFRAGSASGGGVTALFYGESGTGKTMAASALARELGMPLLRADLSGVMDKYIGETEKHLDRLFDCARENNCVLFFDEADALFGKRTAVESSHDKYANVSTSYLLQRLEQQEGVVLLATNLIHNFDEAFLRRIQYMVKFPMPDAALREELWRRAFPPGRAGEDVDAALLAGAELSPARIRETARSAAVLALCEGEDRVSLRRIVQALKLEQEKNGKLLPRFLQRYEEGEQPPSGAPAPKEGSRFGPL